jgi:hypothetical protein
MAIMWTHIDGISDICNQRSLGNVRIWLFWRLPYGTISVDTM